VQELSMHRASDCVSFRNFTNRDFSEEINNGIFIRR